MQTLQEELGELNETVGTDENTRQIGVSADDECAVAFARLVSCLLRHADGFRGERVVGDGDRAELGHAFHSQLPHATTAVGVHAEMLQRGEASEVERGVRLVEAARRHLQRADVGTDVLQITGSADRSEREVGALEINDVTGDGVHEGVGNVGEAQLRELLETVGTELELHVLVHVVEFPARVELEATRADDEGFELGQVCM